MERRGRRTGGRSGRERREKSAVERVGRDARIRERVAIREQPTLLGGLGALSVYRRTTAHPSVVVLVGARMNGTLA